MSLDKTSKKIFETVRNLMADVYKHRHIKNCVEIGQKLKPKYQWLYDNYFPIYRATVFGEMNLNMLVTMLYQKQRIDNNKVSLEVGSQQIGKALAKKYNVDLEKLEKDIIEKNQKK
jgi:hypothetical protein